MRSTQVQKEMSLNKRLWIEYIEAKYRGKFRSHRDSFMRLPDKKGCAHVRPTLFGHQTHSDKPMSDNRAPNKVPLVKSAWIFLRWPGWIRNGSNASQQQTQTRRHVPIKIQGVQAAQKSHLQPHRTIETES